MTQQSYRLYYDDSGEVNVFETIRSGGYAMAYRGGFDSGMDAGFQANIKMISSDTDSGGTDLDISMLPGGVTELKIELTDDVMGDRWTWAFSCIEPEAEVPLVVVLVGETVPTILDTTVASLFENTVTIDLTALPVGATHIRFNQ